MQQDNRFARSVDFKVDPDAVERFDHPNLRAKVKPPTHTRERLNLQDNKRGDPALWACGSPPHQYPLDVPWLRKVPPHLY
jgi:hypothetical protein